MICTEVADTWHAPRKNGIQVSTAGSKAWRLAGTSGGNAAPQSCNNHTSPAWQLCQGSEPVTTPLFRREASVITWPHDSYHGMAGQFHTEVPGKMKKYCPRTGSSCSDIRDCMRISQLGQKSAYTINLVHIIEDNGRQKLSSILFISALPFRIPLLQRDKKK
jgi:hypothetical protein